MIQLEKVSKQYGKVRALQDVSFTVETGTLFGLIGPDGAGKTTLFRILATLILPDSGRVSVLGLDPVKDYRALRLKLGYMPGRFSLYPDLTVRENLDFYARVFGTTVRENYNLVRPVYHMLEPFENRRAGQLSGGMKQKLALSCALIHRPEVLLLDEPTTGVDAVSRKEFWDLLQEIRQTGITILVSTPYMDEATRCQRVALFQEGRILAVDTPAGIMKSFPRPLYGLRTDNTYSLLETLRQWPGARSVHLFGDSVHLSADRQPEEMEELHRWLKARGLADVEIQSLDSGIEDCFLELLAKHNGHG